MMDILKLLVDSSTCQLRARRASMLFEDVLLRTRRALTVYKVYGIRALMVLSETPLDSVNNLLALDWRYDSGKLSYILKGACLPKKIVTWFFFFFFFFFFFTICDFSEVCHTIFFIGAASWSWLCGWHSGLINKWPLVQIWMLQQFVPLRQGILPSLWRGLEASCLLVAHSQISCIVAGRWNPPQKKKKKKKSTAQ